VASRPRMVAGQPAHVDSAPKVCPKGVVVELKRKIVEGKGGKEGEGGRSATNLWPTGIAWPPLNPYFHPPLHLVPLMLTPLTKSIKSNANSFHLFSKFFLFFLKFLDFILCNNEINMMWKRSKKLWMKGGEIKIKYANGGRRVKMKYEITTNLFS
jgi:hypothetical protein